MSFKFTKLFTLIFLSYAGISTLNGVTYPSLLQSVQLLTSSSPIIQEFLSLVEDMDSKTKSTAHLVTALARLSNEIVLSIDCQKETLPYLMPWALYDLYNLKNSVQDLFSETNSPETKKEAFKQPYIALKVVLTIIETASRFTAAIMNTQNLQARLYKHNLIGISSLARLSSLAIISLQDTNQSTSAKSIQTITLALVALHILKMAYDLTTLKTNSFLTQADNRQEAPSDTQDLLLTPRSTQPSPLERLRREQRRQEQVSPFANTRNPINPTMQTARGSQSNFFWTGVTPATAAGEQVPTPPRGTSFGASIFRNRPNVHAQPTILPSHNRQFSNPEIGRGGREQQEQELRRIEQQRQEILQRRDERERRNQEEQRAQNLQREQGRQQFAEEQRQREQQNAHNELRRQQQLVDMEQEQREMERGNQQFREQAEARRVQNQQQWRETVQQHEHGQRERQQRQNEELRRLNEMDTDALLQWQDAMNAVTRNS